jgi:transcriptional regulator with XRE-family HTH domain
MTVISKNLRKIREKNTQYTQKDVAELLGIKQNTYSTWESGESDVKSEYIPKLAEIFGSDIKDFFKTSTNKIEITQTNIDNKDNSVNNSIVLVVPDKESLEKLVESLKINFSK